MDLPVPQNFRVGFSFDKQGTHTFAFGWEIDSPQKVLRYLVEFSIDQKMYYRVPGEMCQFAELPEKRIDIPFSAFVGFLQACRDGRGALLDMRNHRHIYWRLIAEFHDVAGHSSSDVVSFEMPPLE